MDKALESTFYSYTADYYKYRINVTRKIKNKNAVLIFLQEISFVQPRCKSAGEMNNMIFMLLDISTD